MTAAPSHSRGGAPRPGFDFTAHIAAVCSDMTTRVPELRHIDMTRIGVCFSQTRSGGGYGIFASLTPLRFVGGQTHTVRRGRRYAMQRVEVDGREMLYVLTFYLPRFLDLPFREKLITVVHELWHVGPRMDGDLRRFHGRCYAHSGSKEQFDAHAARLAERWLALGPPTAAVEFLRHDFRGLTNLHGRVFGRKISVPKLIPCLE